MSGIMSYMWDKGRVIDEAVRDMIQLKCNPCAICGETDNEEGFVTKFFSFPLLNITPPMNHVRIMSHLSRKQIWYHNLSPQLGLSFFPMISIEVILITCLELPIICLTSAMACTDKHLVMMYTASVWFICEQWGATKNFTCFTNLYSYYRHTRWVPLVLTGFVTQH